MSRADVLAAVCDTFAPGDNELPSASALQVPQHLAAEVDALGRPSLAADLNRFLDTIESPRMNLLLTGRPVRFSALARAEREDYLRRWAESALPQKRKAFQVMKQLVLFHTYATEDSPYWKLAGYTPPTLTAPATPAPLRVRSPEPGETINADACVIGSGAGGGVVAARLASAGKRVVILEQGSFRSEKDFDGRERKGFETLYLDRGLAATEDGAISLLAGCTVGGGTVVNWSTSLRLTEAVREEWRGFGIEDDLDPRYDAIEARLHIDTDESARNGPNGALERGLRALQLACRTIPRNVRGCADCGHCGFGCRMGAKQSMMRTYLVDASRDGAEILAPCEARRIEVSNGRVQSVVARVAGGELRINTPLVALAGGSILSPALLLRSGIAASQAGRNLHLHPATVIFGVYDDMSPAWQGVPQSILSDAFAEQVGGFGFRLECPVALPGIMASALPWWGGSDHRDQMAQARQTAPFLGLVRDRGSGRVGIDRWGEPVLRYKVGALERRHLTQAIVEASRIHLAAGARRIGSLHTPPLFLEGRGLDRYRAEVERRGIEPNRLLLFSAHQMSTCRIGRHARESVANPDGQVWGVAGLFVLDASAFPTASGVNPMLTTMALASRTAERML